MVSAETDVPVPSDDDLHHEEASQADETVAEDVPEKVAIMFKEFDNAQKDMKLQIEGKLEDLKTKEKQLENVLAKLQDKSIDFSKKIENAIENVTRKINQVEENVKSVCFRIDEIEQVVNKRNESQTESSEEVKTSEESRNRSDRKSKHDADGEEGGEDKHKIFTIKGFDFKMAPRPDKYDNCPGDYEEWKELFTASLLALDVQWSKILDAFQGDKAMKAHDINKVLIDELGMSESAANQAKKMLYVNLLQYTKASANDKVKSNGADLSFETWRSICAKGKNATVSHKLNVRNRVMHPEIANKNDDIEKKMDLWKADMRYLREVCPEESILSDDQLKTIMISMVPESVADYLLQRYNTLSTFDMMHDELTDYLERTEQIKKRGKGLMQ